MLAAKTLFLYNLQLNRISIKFYIQMKSKQLTQQIKIKNIPGKTPENETDCLHTKNLFLIPSSHTMKLTVLSQGAGSESAPRFTSIIEEALIFPKRFIHGLKRMKIFTFQLLH